MEYATRFIERWHIPDDRLARATLWPDGWIIFEARVGHVHPELWRRMGAMSEAVAGAGVLALDYDHADLPPAMMAWIEVGDGEADIMGMRVGPGDGFGLPPFFEVRCRSEHVDPAFVRELNEIVFPQVCGVLVPSGVDVGV